tara:strand:- start:152 stop:310 length:159 start_codon:yes stop_codon:yes gene_type:complete
MKKIIVMLLWMSFAAWIVILVDSYFLIPDEITGVVYFISIGVAVSSVLNYYK